MSIIAICGFQGAGKDTLADILVNNYGFIRVSFAGAVKDVASAIFGWDREMLEGRTKESREKREVIDEWLANRLSIPHLTPINYLEKQVKLFI
jgi:adenylate kinase family enzyme